MNKLHLNADSLRLGTDEPTLDQLAAASGKRMQVNPTLFRAYVIKVLSTGPATVDLKDA